MFYVASTNLNEKGKRHFETDKLLSTLRMAASPETQTAKETFKPDEDGNSFTVGKIICQKQIFLGQHNAVFCGFWKENDKTTTEVVVKKVHHNDCSEKWEEIIDKHLKSPKSINHDNILKIYGFEDVPDQWRSVILKN